MNIYYLSHDPAECATMHSDRHVDEMCLEYATILSTVHWVTDGIEWKGTTLQGVDISTWVHPDPTIQQFLYKATESNSAVVKWAGMNVNNYQWLCALWINMCTEYCKRYGKANSTIQELYPLMIWHPATIGEGVFEPPPVLVDADCVVDDPIESYRNHYVKNLYGWKGWEMGTPTPEWYKHAEL